MAYFAQEAFKPCREPPRPCLKVYGQPKNVPICVAGGVGPPRTGTPTEIEVRNNRAAWRNGLPGAAALGGVGRREAGLSLFTATTRRAPAACSRSARGAADRRGVCQSEAWRVLEQGLARPSEGAGDAQARDGTERQMATARAWLGRHALREQPAKPRLEN